MVVVACCTDFVSVLFVVRSGASGSFGSMVRVGSCMTGRFVLGEIAAALVVVGVAGSSVA